MIALALSYGFSNNIVVAKQNSTTAIIEAIATLKTGC